MCRAENNIITPATEKNRQLASKRERERDRRKKTTNRERDGCVRESGWVYVFLSTIFYSLLFVSLYSPTFSLWCIYCWFAYTKRHSKPHHATNHRHDSYNYNKYNTLRMNNKMFLNMFGNWHVSFFLSLLRPNEKFTLPLRVTSSQPIQLLSVRLCCLIII